jgi:hypothetical protein
MSQAFRLSSVALPLACLVLGAGAAVVAWGQHSADRAYVNEQAAAFQSLSPEQQSNVRKSYSLYTSQSEQRRAEIAEIYRQTTADATLEETLARYSDWRSALSLKDRESLQELSGDDRIRFVQDRWAETPAASDEILVEFRGDPAARMPSLSLSFEEFWKIISAAVPESERSESLVEELSQLKSNKHRALRLALTMFDRTPGQNNFRELESRGELFRTAVLNHLEDEQWKNRFRFLVQEMDRKPFARPWLMMTLLTILDKATSTLGEDLSKEFPVKNEQMIDAFAELQKKADGKALQRSLMTMAPEEARARMELLAQTSGAETPEQMLLTRFNTFMRERQAFLREPFGAGRINPGFNPERPRSPDDSKRPPRSDSGRRPPQR